MSATSTLMFKYTFKSVNSYQIFTCTRVLRSFTPVRTRTINGYTNAQITKKQGGLGIPGYETDLDDLMT